MTQRGLFEERLGRLTLLCTTFTVTQANHVITDALFVRLTGAWGAHR